MSNRKKTYKEKRDRFLKRIKGETGLDLGLKVEGTTIRPPMEEKVVLKTVPAVIHWKDWDEVDREDDEIIGDTVVYEDGTFEMVIDRNISMEAKGMVNTMQANIGAHFSLKED